MIRQAKDSKALILAAHGSMREPEVNVRVKALADQIRSQNDFDEVLAAFHQGEPSYCDVLDHVTSDEIVVVPLMTSEGYYTTEKLPMALALNPRIKKVKLVQTRPVGTHPSLKATLAKRTQLIATDQKVDSIAFTIALIGHGTPRNASSRYETEAAAAAVSRRLPHAQLLTAYLDDHPPIESIMERANHSMVIVIPFLIGGGTHAVRDLPYRLGLASEINDHEMVKGHVAGKQVVVDIPIGQYAEIVDWVMQLATHAAKEI